MKERDIKRIILFLLICIIVSCTGNKRYDYLLQRADSIMDLNDDSAKVSIKMLDSVKPQLNDFTKKQRMRYGLLYHKAMNKAGISFVSDSVMKKIVDYYDHHGTANEQMLANYILGCVYRDMHEAPMALEYYNKATEKADTTAADCDYGTLYRVYSQMGFLFSKQYLPNQLLNAFRKAEKYAYLAKDTLNAIVNFQNQGEAFAYFGNNDSVIAINLHAAKLFKKYGNDYAAAIAFGCNYELYLEKNDTLRAKEAFKAYSSTGFEGNTNYDDAKAYVLYQKGTYYLFADQLDSACNYLLQSLKLCMSYSMKAVTTKALARYYARNNQPTLAMKYAMVSSEYNDSDLMEARTSQLQQLQAMYDYGRNQKIAKSAEIKAEKRSFFIYILIFGSLTILLSLSYAFLRQMREKKKKIVLARQLYEDSLQKLKNMQEELTLLVAVNNSKLANVIKEKENAISKLKEEIEDIRDKFSNSSLSNVDVLLKQSSIYQKIRHIEQHPMEKMDDEDWIELKKLINLYIPSFEPLLRNRLNETDYRICLLVRLEISTSTMAILLGLSASAISKYRKEMLMKLCGKSGKPKEFDEYILQIT